MIGGFLGTVIALERAVALGRGWAYAAPVTTGLGAAALAAGAPGGPWLMLAGSGITVLIFVTILRVQFALFTVVMALGAAAWLAGQVAWVAGAPIHRTLVWWAAFVVLTIAGERLELTRLLQTGRAARAAFLAVLAVLLAGPVVASVAPDAGLRLTGVGWLALATWLARFDIARRTVRTTGLPRFIAVALLSGYAWLGLGGLLALGGSVGAAGARYDALVHAVFVGFVFSLIFGHAPIVFPAVLGVAVPYRPAFYLPLAVLHGSLALRILGDLAAWNAGRQWGGLLNAVAIVGFLASMAYGARRAAGGGHPSPLARPRS
jgi:hypothetical protein